jgi:hypothetical protein
MVEDGTQSGREMSRLHFNILNDGFSSEKQQFGEFENTSVDNVWAYER